ncbi:Anp1-domain-containing protein [Elsinoe ampelina]|uniref:Anp1-domain-containing protein n=1 Tax=Elsinoe ampelina TaxID=302913 RepID=A0A6A6GDZ9_9PEZI|nr:Anp1-domain-containing protein [Elsinoe ampelina]
MTKDESSFADSLDDDDRPRTIDDMHQLMKFQHDPSSISLGLLTSSDSEYELYKHSAYNHNYSRVTIFRHPGYLPSDEIEREHRHDEEAQTARRSEMAKLRNFLMLQTLRGEEHIIWMDADIYRIDAGLVTRMLRHAQDREDVGILTARTELGNITGSNYDLNCWAGTRKGPRDWDLDPKEIENRELALQGQLMLTDLQKRTGENDLVFLDAIGATLLYMKSELVWLGLSFPHQYMVGTRWGKDGWDGIESEGLRYRTRGMIGGRCAALGGDWKIGHA